VQNILSIIQSAPARVLSQPDPTRPIWRIDDPRLLTRRRRAITDAVESCREQLLEALLAAAPHVYLVHNDDPASEGVPGIWARVGASSWRVPPNVDQHEKAMRYWLHTLGNWIMFVAPSPIEEPLADPFGAPQKLLDWMSRNGVKALLSAYADASEWVLALSDNTTSRTAARNTRP
jgi:hypothetical protein